MDFNKLTRKQYQEMWEEFKDNIRNATPIDTTETLARKKKRMAALEKEPEDWFRYYFPEFASEDPAPFHIKATKRIMKHPEWYEVRNWSRELAKSTRSMLEDLYLMLVGHPVVIDGTPGRLKKKYKILASSTYDAAELLLQPYKLNLEANQRIINDYGQQEKPGFWSPGSITSKCGFMIKAFGIDQKPRGTKFKQVRPDIIEFDDYDTDAACLNPDMVDKNWKLATKAFIGTRSISKPTIIRWNGNIIAEDCCIVRAQEFADHHEVINIRDDNGVSTWAKNTEEFIDRTLKILPYSAQQSEYYNNPYVEGKIFREIKWGKVPPLRKFPFLVAYGDPSTSNKDKGKGNSKTSNKALILVGVIDMVYYVIKCRVDRMKTSDYVDCFFQMDIFVNGKTQLFGYIENNGFQNPFYEQVFLPLFSQKIKEFGRVISIIPDTSEKPDKYTRIEGTLEPLNRLGMLIFNEDEKEDADMKRLVDQMKAVNPMSKLMDGPDALTGAVVMTNTRNVSVGGIELFARPENIKRF